MDEETAAKHAAFVRARGRHYSNEAEAMKRAAQMMEDEDEDEDVPPVPRRNQDDTDEDSLNSGTETSGTALENGVKLNGVNHHPA